MSERDAMRLAARRAALHASIRDGDAAGAARAAARLRIPGARLSAQELTLALDTRAALEVIEPAEIDAFVGRDMRFTAGERRLEFTAENFLLSFSQPNFYFHAATTYDLLRWKGVRIGKRDFTGRLRTKPIAARA